MPEGERDTMENAGLDVRSDVLTTEQVAERRRRGFALQNGDAPALLQRVKVGVLSTFTTDLLSPFLMEALGRIGLYADVHQGEFGQLTRESLDTNSELYAAEPDEVVLIPALEDLLETLFDRPGRLSPDDVENLIEGRLDEMASVVRTLLERLPSATVYVVVFGTDRAPLGHVTHPNAPQRGQTAVQSFLETVRSLGDISPRVVIVDWDWRLRTDGARRYKDERLWYLGRMRLNPLGLATLSELIARHVAANRGMAYKVAVVDLDNTLWGGVVGEDGVRDIVLGNEGLGLAFVDFQKELLNLHDMGVVLAICSKNNPDDAWEVFDTHPASVLKREHFAAARVNWQDKASNLRELSDELDLGVDSFVFLDDNPVERAWVRSAIPEVFVPELPDDPAHRPDFLRDAPFFQRVALTESDLVRAASYRAQGERKQLQSKSISFEEFLDSLDQKATISPLHQGSVARAAQMCQRTNQFNLTTRRYTVSDLETMQNDASVEVYTLAIEDRFGDSGITGLGIMRFQDDTAEIDTFLLSCRVLGRMVEDAFVAFLAQRAGKRGVKILMGNFIPTAKNGQVADLYPGLGFETIEVGKFRLDLEHNTPGFPSQISLKAETHA